MTTVLVALCGAGVGLGAVLILGGLFPPATRAKRSRRLDAAIRRSTIVALAGAVVAGVITRTPAGVIIGGAIGWSGASALLVTRRRSRTDELDDLATWVETLRDNVFARQGLLGAIEATESSAPASLRPKIAALVARVRSGLSLDRALVALAHDFGDGAVDDVIAPLVLASRIGGPDLHAILSGAAVRTRDQLAITLHAEVARAKPRREMRTIAIATVVLVVTTMAIGHKYFAPFATPIGQVVLVGIAMVFAAGFMMMNRLARPTLPPRLFEEVVS